MKKKKPTRLAAIEKDGKMTQVPFEELKPGDLFRLFETDGSPVTDKEGNVIFLATSAPYWDPCSVAWAIKIETIVNGSRT